MTEAEIRADERQRCAAEIEQFASDYVERWYPLEGDGAKAQAWAMQIAAQNLRGCFDARPRKAA